MVSPSGNFHHLGDHIQSGQFAFVAVEDGDHVACFWGTEHNPQITLTIDFDWRTGVAAKDWSNIAKKGHIDVSHHYHYMPLIFFMTIQLPL